MNFPLAGVSGPELAPLSETEAEALRSLHNACVHLDRERGEALSHALHLRESAAIVGDYLSGTAFPQHPRALKELSEVALAYERQAEAIVWRYASAYAVLAITVLDRLVSERPPLDADAVEELCQEPTIGRLRAALSIPSSRLIAPSDGEQQDEVPIGSHALTAVEEVRAEVLHSGEKAMDEQAVDASRLSAVRPVHVTPLGLSLSFTLPVATTASWEIYKYLKRE
ncbi:hypothetical protein ACIGXA_22830 [Streptomyces fildesensis]|uniref:Uncharacterized protein n=1 Tax=Streptomyces fildesensis TaxID=375757 RepID=A0ABW8CA91_9ACTN